MTNELASKKDMVKMTNEVASKEDIQEVKAMMNEIRLYSSPQEDDKDENKDLFQS